MDISNGSNTNKPKVHKIEIAKRLYFLNYYLNKLKQQIIACQDEMVSAALIAEMKKLYILKNRVLTKMLVEGYARIRQHQVGCDGRYYIVRINRDITFHLPITKYVKKALYENTTDGIEICSKKQGI